MGCRRRPGAALRVAERERESTEPTIRARAQRSSRLAAALCRAATELMGTGAGRSVVGGCDQRVRGEHGEG